jgi:hypothetical protein
MGTHLSFVRSSELDMWSLRQLAYLEQAGNKVVKTFFRNHGITSTVDYTSQIAERWRNELLDKVNEIYPKFSDSKKDDPKKSSTSEPKAPVSEETKAPPDPSPPTDQSIPKPEKLAPKPMQPVIPRSTFKAPSSEAKHKFRKSKVEDSSTVSFKPVSFKAQTEEEEFFDPQPLKAPSKALDPPPAPTAAPSVIQRKPLEKKAISSEDYEASFSDPRAQKARINQFSGANSISSDMYFGRESNKESEFNADKLRDEAARLGSMALDKASQVLDK